MLKATDSSHAPWRIVRTDDKKRGRLNCIADILKRIPHKRVKVGKVKLPKRSEKGSYDDDASIRKRRFVAQRF
jgi:hypothetical protein